MSVLGKEKRIEILAHLTKGAGIRWTADLCVVSRTTVAKLALDVGEGAAILHDQLMRDLPVDLVQVDEQWNFVKKKQKRVKPDDDAATVGDQWTHLAVDVVSRAAISFIVGKRTAATARSLVTDLRSRIRGRFQATADGHRPYSDAFIEICGDTVDFGQLVKRYECDEREAKGLPLGRKRYTGSEPVIISGDPDVDEISTSRIERTNLSNRMEHARFARKTLRHSKDLRHHRAATALYYTHFNLCRIHETLRATPAVALEVTTQPWALGEFIEACLDARKSIAVDQSSEVEPIRPRFVVFKGGRGGA